MSNVQFGTNTPSLRKMRLYYTETSTIYEGMPVCYEYEATTNVLGYSKSEGGEDARNQTTKTTTGEGYQNEGKFLHVENPASANLMFFAGVVAQGGYCGKTGPLWLDIYEPNGATVPIRTYVSSTVGKTAVAIGNGLQYFGNPTAGMSNGSGRFVAVCEETVDRSSTAGLCLARLDPHQFIYQTFSSTKVECGTSNTYELTPNLINLHSSQATGTFTALFVRSEVDTADSGDVSLAIYGEANVLGVAAGSYCISSRFSLNLWGGTQTAVHIHALGAEIYEEGANLTGTSVISPLFLRTQIDATNPPAANSHYMMTCRCDGADKPDGLLFAVSADAIKFEAVSSGTTASHHIPIRVAGVTYYILCEDTA